MRRESYAVSLSRSCAICHAEFTATSSRQVICPEEHLSPCSVCGESMVIDHRNFTRGRGSYCDNICSTLGQNNSPLRRELIPQYKDLNTWAREFKDMHGRKPTRHDFTEHFGVPLPRSRHDTTLFDLSRGSGWEFKVESFLRERYPRLSLKPHHRQRLARGKLMEIDLYIPSLSLGFEVQDEKTHSKHGDDVPSPFGGYKKGPLYHGEKIAGYAALGITVVEIWQDDIESGEYKRLIEEAVLAREDSNSLVE